MRKLLPLLCLAAGCNFRGYVVDRSIAEQVQYIPDPEHRSGYELVKLTEHAYSFRWTWDRSLVVITDEGVVVFDPFNAEAAKALKGELDKVAPGKPVHTMFYSHYHLDHVVGGGALQPQRVVGHKTLPAYWADLADVPDTKAILPITQPIEGDQKFVIGGVEIDLLELGHSHTDSIYAFYLPGEKLLHTCDIGLVRTVMPLGGPDMYMPGVNRALERLAKLDFDTWVPSHFDLGKKADLVESLQYFTTLRRLALETVAKYGLPRDPDDFVAAFHHIYDPMKELYGTYNGFDQQSLFLVSRAYSGATLGY